MQVDVVCLRGPGGPPLLERVNGVRVLRIPVPRSRGGALRYVLEYGAFLLASAIVLAARTAMRRYDLVHVHNMPDVLVASALIPKALGAKVVLDLHDPMPELMTVIFGLRPDRAACRILRALERWSIRRADLVLTPNAAFRRLFLSRGCPARKLHVVMNSPDEDVFGFHPPERNGSRGDGRAPFVVMYHGTIVERNGLDLAVDALGLVRRSIANAELWIYGAETPFLARVMDSARSRGLLGAVRYLGPRPIEDIVRAIARCRVGVVPNRRNAFTELNLPTRIFEYLTMGKPVIAPRSAGILDYFAEPELLFFEPGDAGDLARRIEWAALRPVEVAETVERGQAVVRRHAWAQERENLVARVEELIGAEGRASPAITRDDARRSLARVEAWVHRNDYRGYEPFDGLSSRARPLTLGTELGERILQQVVRQSPWNLRPLLGIPRLESTKGRGCMAWGYWILFRAAHDARYADEGERCLDWLAAHRAPGFRDHAWSNHFDFTARGGRYTKDEPILVWTSLIAHAFVEGYEATRREEFLRVAESACRWILALPRERTARGDCLSYLPGRQLSIHNANMLGAGLLARVAAHTGGEELRSAARSAMEYSCSRQRPDGSWWYAEAPRFRWIDSFHTGYSLDSLRWFIEGTGDEALRPRLERGLAFFKESFVEPDGRPRYYHTRTYPVDIQCAAQAIDTLALFSDEDPECLDLSAKVAAWTIANMQDPRSGAFHYRRYPGITARTPMLHWGQATMFKALARLVARFGEDEWSTGS
jgi:glycosyltransferase involved in cell wall biosynthesis